MTSGAAGYGRSRRRRWGGAFLAAVLLAGLAAAVAVRLAERAEVPAVSTPPPAPVAVVRVEAGPFEVTRRYPGSVAAHREAAVAAEAAGRLTALHHREGDAVREGAVIARVDDRDARLEVRRLEASAEQVRSDLAFWRDQLAGDRELAADGALPQRELEETGRRVRSLEASLAEREAALAAAVERLERTTLRAPFSGVVAVVHRLPGEWAGHGAPVVELYDPASLKAVADIPQSDLAAIIPGLSAVIRIPVTGAAVSATVDRVHPGVTGPVRAGRIEALLPGGEGEGPNALRPGMAVEMEVRLHTALDAVTVPAEAVHRRRGETGVYLLDGDRARWRPVTTGAATGGHIEIVAGLKPGDPVIVTPHPALEDGQPPVRASLREKTTP